MIYTKESIYELIKEKSTEIFSFDTGKPRNDKHFRDEINSVYKNISWHFGSQRNYGYDEKIGEWKERGISTVLFGNSNKIDMNETRINNIVGEYLEIKIENREKGIELLKEIVSLILENIPREYNYEGKEWDKEPTKEEMDDAKEKRLANTKSYNEYDTKRKELKEKMDNFQFDKEKGQYLIVQIEKDKKVKESEKSTDLELQEEALKNNLHYTEWRYDEYDGPSYAGSYTYNITGKIYAIKLNKDSEGKIEKVDAWKIKRLIPLLEKDGYKCKFHTGSGSYGSRTYEMEIYEQIEGITYKPEGDSYIVKIDYNVYHTPITRERFQYSKNVIFLDDDTIQIDKTDNKWDDDRENCLLDIAYKNVQRIRKDSCSSLNINYLPRKLEGDDFEVVTEDSVTVKNVESASTDCGNFELRVNDKGVEIKFPNKPSQEVIDKIKGNGWRWAMGNKVWYKVHHGNVEKIKQEATALLS